MGSSKFCELILSDRAKKDIADISKSELWRIFISFPVVEMFIESSEFKRLKGTEDCRILNVLDYNTHNIIRVESETHAYVLNLYRIKGELSVWDSGSIDDYSLSNIIIVSSFQKDEL